MAEIASGGGFDRDSSMGIWSIFERPLSDAKPAKSGSKSQQLEPLTFVKGALTSFLQKLSALCEAVRQKPHRARRDFGSLIVRPLSEQKAKT